jgi:hypothetical protein
MTKSLFSLLLLLAFPFVVWSQSPGVCGTEVTSESITTIKELKKWIAEGNLSARGNTVTYVPVKFHIIQKADGTLGVSEARVLDVLCHLNESFADQDIQFYIYNGFNYIKNNAAYTDPSTATLVLQGNRDSKAMNIFIGENPTSQSGPPGGTTLGYFTPGNDWIVMRKSEINGFSATLPHEVGHYFALMHPFNGWDCTSWTAEEHGNPVSSLTSPCNPEVPVEFANGNNCDEAGDFLCDTPADYNFGFLDNDDCVYNFDCLDPNGDEMDPMENNFMGYFEGCAEFFFTAQQKQIVAARLAQRASLATNYTPPATVIESAPNLIQPANNSVMTNSAVFEWEAVPGANQYLLEIDFANNFSVSPIRLIVWGTYKVVQGLLPNRPSYFWRVRPFNAYQTCAPNSVTWKFSTGAVINTVEPSYVTNWVVRPNPVSAGQSLQLEMNTNQAFEANIALRTLSGQAVHTIQTSFSTGNSTLDIPTYGLANGIYFLIVQSAEGVINERVVIAN